MGNFGDCEASVGSGCLTDLSSDANRCGGCTKVCPKGTPYSSYTTCSSGICGISNCSTNTADCDLIPANQCESMLTTDPFHCGNCSTNCSSLGKVAGHFDNALCSNSTCAYNCSSGFGDCDKKGVNGCEANLTASDTCGSCDKNCSSLSNVLTADCMNGSCIPTACNPGFSQCSASPIADAGCTVNLQNDKLNCGNCSLRCMDLPNVNASTVSCVNGNCQFQCLQSWGNCDNNPKNGCETSLLSSASHCGVCGRSCAGISASAGHYKLPLSCVNGLCNYLCVTGWANCDLDQNLAVPVNGCECPA